MSLKSRLDKLEQRQPSDHASFEVIIVFPGESEEQAKQKWQAEHPGMNSEKALLVRFVKSDGTYA